MGTSSVEGFLNFFVAVGYIALASKANILLLIRDHKLRQEELTPLLERHVSHPYERSAAPNEEMGDETAPLTPKETRGSRRLSYPDRVVTAQKPPPLEKPLWTDLIWWFYVTIIIFCVVCSSVSVILTIWEEENRKALGFNRNSRKHQDFIVSFSTALFFCISLLLIHTFHRCLSFEQPVPFFARTSTLFFGVAFFVLTFMTVDFLLLAGVLSEVVLEIVSCALQFILVVLYSYTAVSVPRQLRGMFGDEVEQQAKRIAVVSYFMAVFMTLRLVIILPFVQGDLVDFGPVALVVQFVLDCVPLLIILHLLSRL